LVPVEVARGGSRMCRPHWHTTMPSTTGVRSEPRPAQNHARHNRPRSEPRQKGITPPRTSLQHHGLAYHACITGKEHNGPSSHTCTTGEARPRRHNRPSTSAIGLITSKKGMPTTFPGRRTEKFSRPLDVSIDRDDVLLLLCDKIGPIPAGRLERCVRCRYITSIASYPATCGKWIF
jgi:hypothetical protein